MNISPEELPKVTVEYKPILPFDLISAKNEIMLIHHEKYLNLTKNCITFRYMFDKNFKETDLTNVTCENVSYLNWKITESIFISIKH